MAATTAAIEELLEGATSQVTTRTLDDARMGVAGASVNLFLYRDELVTYRDGTDPKGIAHILAELNYLVSTHPSDAADESLFSQRAYGAARAAIEGTPVLMASGGPDGPFQVRLTRTALTLDDLTSLWTASSVPLRLAFGVTASFALTVGNPTFIPGTIDDVVAKATAGLVVVFGGTDIAAKAVAADSVAMDLGQPILEVALDQVVSKYIAETEQNLARLFDAAEDKEVILFLDEADALFGRRTDTPDAHDRYADVEVGAVLDLFTRAPGIVILGLRGAAAEELERRASVWVRFPPEEG